MAINTNPTSAAQSVGGTATGTQIANFIPSVWSKKILDRLKEECKLVDNCWQEYEGDVKHAGAVHILGVGTVTVGNYAGGNITYSKVSDEGQTLPIDQAKYFALMFDDVERAQTMEGLWESTNEEAVRKLAVARDSYIAGLIKEASTSGALTYGDKAYAATSLTTTAANLTPQHVKEAIDTGLVELKKRNFAEEAVIELTPAVANAFLNSLTQVSTDNPEYIKKGVIGFYHGHKVVESNCLLTQTVSGKPYDYCCIRGKKAIAFAGQLNKVEALRLQDHFADAVRGLDVYGAKIIDRARIQALIFPSVYTAEA